MPPRQYPANLSGAEHASRSQQYGEISERIDAQVFVGNDLDDAVAFQLAIGPAREVYRESGKLAEGRHEEIANALKTALAKYRRPNGVIMDFSLEGDRKIRDSFVLLDGAKVLGADCAEPAVEISTLCRPAFQPALTPSASAYR